MSEHVWVTPVGSVLAAIPHITCVIDHGSDCLSCIRFVVVRADLCVNPSEDELAAHMTTASAPKAGTGAGVYQKIAGKKTLNMSVGCSNSLSGFRPGLQHDRHDR